MLPSIGTLGGKATRSAWRDCGASERCNRPQSGRANERLGISTDPAALSRDQSVRRAHVAVQEGARLGKKGHRATQGGQSEDEGGGQNESVVEWWRGRSECEGLWHCEEERRGRRHSGRRRKDRGRGGTPGEQEALSAAPRRPSPSASSARRRSTSPAAPRASARRRPARPSAPPSGASSRSRGGSASGRRRRRAWAA